MPVSPICSNNRWCIFTPLPGTDPAALERLSEFWRRCGSNIDTMDADHHDMVLAIVSHLPHIIAYNIVGTADDLEAVTKSEVIKYSASGFRDFTRLAASDPTMWRDVCLYNKDAILEMLARFSEDLASLQRAIRWGDGEKLFDMFTRTRAIRRSIIEAGQEIDAPDFGRQAIEHPGAVPCRKSPSAIPGKVGTGFSSGIAHTNTEKWARFRRMRKSQRGGIFRVG